MYIATASVLVNIYDQKRAMKQSCTEYMPTVSIC